MPLMGNLYIGSSGLQTSQNALHTVAHNLANVDTVGYTRQQTVLGDKRYTKIGDGYISSKQTGLGVTYEKVRQVRDAFLDKSYRKEVGRSSYYETSYTASNEVATLFGELEGVEFQTSLTNLWSAVQELAKDPTNATNQGMMVSVAAEFIDRAKGVYNGLSELQSNYNQQILDRIDKINDYGKQIQKLNLAIQSIEGGKSEGHNVEEANDIRDQRNQLLDELASMVKITYYEDTFGAVNIQIEGKDFLTRTYLNPMGVTTDEESGFHTPVWPKDGDAPVYSFTREISTDLDTDIGGLKALLILRGEDKGTFLDIPQEEDPSTWYMINDDGDRVLASTYKESAEYYNKHTGKSLLQNTMAEFDALIHGVVKGINEVLNARATDSDGNPVYNANGERDVNGIDLFVRTGIDTDYKQTSVQDEDVTDKATLYTLDNIYINPLVLQNYTLLGAKSFDGGKTYNTGFRTEDGREDNTMVNNLKDLFADSQLSLNPTLSTKLNFTNYYTNLVGDVAEKGYVFKGVAEGMDTTVQSLEASRQAIVGVSDSEELNNMIMYQNAYNASSRYINVINTLLENLINLGR